MRTSRNKRQNQSGRISNRVQNRLKQTRGKVDQQQIQNINLINSFRRKSNFNGVSPLNRDYVQAVPYATNTRNLQRRARHNRSFQQRGIQVFEGQTNIEEDEWMQVTKSEGQNRNRLSRKYGLGEQSGSFRTGPMIRGRLKHNFGYMRSDVIAQRQQIQEDSRLSHLLILRQQQEQQQQRQRQQQTWLHKSLHQLRAGSQVNQKSSARTTTYEPLLGGRNVGTTVTVQIPNVKSSGQSDVTVVFGKKVKRRKTGNASSRSIALYQPSGSARQKTDVQAKNRNKKMVSFEEDVNVETVGSPVCNIVLSTRQEDSEEDVLVV